MTDTIYAVAGSFAMRPGTPKGIHVFRYKPETGEFTPIGDYRPEINAGQSVWDPVRHVLYITHEGKEFGEERGSGGRVFALRLDETSGEPEWLSESCTGSTLPSYLCLDPTGRYLLIPHHVSGDTVLKTVRRADGSFTTRLVRDDCTLALYERNMDGTVGMLKDVYVQEGEEAFHFHSCVLSPNGKQFLVCDKGADCIRRFGLVAETGTLQYLGDTFVEKGAHPRYGVSHPFLPIFYQNCENSAFLHVWFVDRETGELKRLQKIPLLCREEEALAWTKEGASDLAVTADGKFLYAAVRGLNLITAFAVTADGTLEFLQNLNCQGQNPRGLTLAPDDRYLFVMNRDSDSIIRFRRIEDGRLVDDGTAAKCGLPGNLTFCV